MTPSGQSGRLRRSAASCRANEEAERPNGVRLAARMGIATGEVVVVDPVAGRTPTSGPPFTQAARLQQADADGDVLLDDATHHLVRRFALVEHVRVRGAGPGVRRLVDVVGEPAVPVASDSALVGREQEGADLADALDSTVSSGRASLVTVVGEAGVGKSRLARAFTDDIDDGRAVVGRCRAYGDGITFRPLCEIVVHLVGNVDMLDLPALLHVGLGEVLVTSGRDGDARSVIDDAVGLYERKGNLVAAQRERAGRSAAAGRNRSRPGRSMW